MGPMLEPVVDVIGGELFGGDDQEVLGISFFGSLCEIERAGDDDRLVDYDDLVVGDGVPVVDKSGDAVIGEERGAGVFLGAVGSCRGRPPR